MSTSQDRLNLGIDRLLRLDYPPVDEVKLRSHQGSTVDAFEMLDALEVLREFFGHTADMVGKPMYRGEKEFDFIRDVKADINNFFLVSDDQKEAALKRRKNRTMVVLMLNPIVDMFQYADHEVALNTYNHIIDGAVEHITNTDAESSAEDAFVVKRLIQKQVQRHNRVVDAVDGIMRLRRKKRKSKK